MFNILLIEEYIILRTGIEALIDVQPDFQIFAEAHTVQEAVTINPFKKIDLIITDIPVSHRRIPKDIEQLRASFPESQILIFTASGNEAGALVGLGAGADGYLFKEASGEELLEAMRRLLDKSNMIQSAVTSTGA